MFMQRFASFPLGAGGGWVTAYIIHGTLKISLNGRLLPRLEIKWKDSKVFYHKTAPLSTAFQRYLRRKSRKI
jgi:hypothetical protein